MDLRPVHRAVDTAVISLCQSTYPSSKWLPTCNATLISVLNAKPFLGFIVAGLCKCVKLHKLLMKTSLKLPTARRADKQAAASNPAKQMPSSRGSWYSSNERLKQPRRGAQMSSSIGRTVSAGKRWDLLKREVDANVTCICQMAASHLFVQ